jgi:hypothetical protein
VRDEASHTLAVGAPMLIGSPSRLLTLLDTLLLDGAPRRALLCALLRHGALWWTIDYLVDGRLVRAAKTHLNVTCDVCHTPSFIGPRYKCTVCPDFDMCDACFYSTHKHADTEFRVLERSEWRAITRVPGAESLATTTAAATTPATTTAATSENGSSSDSAEQRLLTTLSALLERAWRASMAATRDVDEAALLDVCVRALATLQRSLIGGGRRRRRLLADYAVRLLRSCRAALQHGAADDDGAVPRRSPLGVLLPPLLTALSGERVPSALASLLPYIGCVSDDETRADGLSSFTDLLQTLDSLCVKSKVIRF